MDGEQEEMQFIGLYGIFKESIKIIISWRKIFSQITLTLILPLTFIFLVHMEVSHIFFSNFRRTEFRRDISRPGSRTYNHLAVVYTIATIYTARDVTNKKVMTVVPRVWKRFMFTFLCMFLILFIFNVIAFLVFVLWVVAVLTTASSVVGGVLLILILILYAVGFVYMTIVWRLASVVSVLEGSYGFKAMNKAIKLITGQRIYTIVIFFLLNISLVGIEILYEIFEVHAWADPNGVGVGLQPTKLETAFHEACRKGNHKVLMRLPEENPWVASKLNCENQSALFLACTYDHLHVVNLLLNYD